MVIISSCLVQLPKKLLNSHMTPLLKYSSRLDSSQPSDFELQHQTPICLKTDPIPLALYGGRHTATMLPGAGIGLELMKHVQYVFKVMGAPVDFEMLEIDANRPDNVELDQALMSIQRNGVALKGNIETNSNDPAVKLRNIALRTHLHLYVYVLWCKSYPSVPAKQKNVDIIVVRQNTEGEYSMLEHSIAGAKIVESLKIITRDKSIKLATYAFEYAEKHKRKKVTTVHKANIMKFSDGMFLSAAKEVAECYPNIEHNNMIIDHCCMELVARPEKFDIILTTNLYGNVVSNTICGLTGGPGLVSGKNYGDHYAVFEPGTRNKGDTIAGQNIANPVAMLNAAVDMLTHLGHEDHAKRLERAIYKTISEDKVHTPDIGGNAGTSDVVKKVLDHIWEGTLKVF